MELPIRGVAGQFRAFLTMALPQRDDEGKIVRWFGTSTDVSVLKMLREELENTAARLEEEDRRKDEFLAMLAHELRNPLAPIRSGLEWMRLRPEDAVGVSEVRAMMERQTHQLIALVDDLLDVSRIRHGKLELRRRTVALADVVGSAVEECEPVIRKAGHHLTVSLPGSDLP
ncbi:MAG: HAMP domain-containing sensor histidine kinase [Bryobacterales bacterium]|nr:HAMP domain-containing sensor histidine kinase [Bryobacterales bacterium]